MKYLLIFMSLFFILKGAELRADFKTQKIIIAYSGFGGSGSSGEGMDIYERNKKRKRYPINRHRSVRERDREDPRSERGFEREPGERHNWRRR